MRFLWVILLAWASTAQAESVSYSFEWQGNGGFVMRGAMSIPEELSMRDRIYESDVSCFEITGFQNDEKIGRWALGMLLPDTTWVLTFNPRGREFLVFGPETPMPQAWNMDGAGYNCGDPGFGFNIGSAAQDLCVDGELMFDSQVPPPQPFPVVWNPSPKFSRDACRPSVLMSAR